MSLPVSDDISSEMLEDTQQMNRSWGAHDKPKVQVPIQHAEPERGAMLEHTSTQIGETIKAIEEGRSTGEFPTVEKIITRRAATQPQAPQQARRRRRPRDYVPQRRLIDDVHPTVREDLAVLKHVTSELKDRVNEHHREAAKAAGQYATKEELGVLDKRMDGFEHSSAMKTVSLVVTIVALSVSMAYNVIMLYKNLHL